MIDQARWRKMVNEQIMMLIMMMALVRLVVSDNDRPNKMVIMIYIYDRKVLTVMFSLFLPCLDLFSWFFMVPGWFFMAFHGSRSFFHGSRSVFHGTRQG